MKPLFIRYAARIDAATLRERVMIFGACAALLVFLAHAVLLEPLRTKQQRLLIQLQTSQAEMKKVQAALASGTLAAAQDLDAPTRAREKALREALAQLNAKIVQEQRRFTTPENMRSVLEELLERNRRLSIVDLKTLPAAPLAVRGTAGAPGLYRHGLELAVSGSYGDIYEYLRALERLPTQIYWGRAELEVAEHPVITLKLTVYTVSFDRAWLIV